MLPMCVLHAHQQGADALGHRAILLLGAHAHRGAEITENFSVFYSTGAI